MPGGIEKPLFLAVAAGVNEPGKGFGIGSQPAQVYLLAFVKIGASAIAMERLLPGSGVLSMTMLTALNRVS